MPTKKKAKSKKRKIDLRAASVPGTMKRRRRRTRDAIDKALSKN